MSLYLCRKFSRAILLSVLVAMWNLIICLLSTASFAALASSQEDPDLVDSGEGHIDSLFTPNFEDRDKATDRATPVSGPPNIVIFLADDLGRGDVSYAEGNLQTPTPNIDKLAWDGIILNRHYSNAICTPSRSALMTGRDAFRLGMQSLLGDGEPWGLPLQFRILPQYLKELGYNTSMFGKWHLGQYTRQFFPNNRGFDYSYWFQGGEANWFNYTSGRVTPENVSGRSLRENNRMIYANITNNYYLPEQLTAQAERYIHNYNRSNPMFLYFSTPVPHAANQNQAAVLQTMAQYEERSPVRNLSDTFASRKQQLALIQTMDEQFRRIVDALVNAGVINNTIIIFISDNGAAIPNEVPSQRANYGSNWPLRKGKASQFEGGVRTLSFIWSPLLQRRGRITNQLFHISDWLPTLYDAAGGNSTNLRSANVTGMSHWLALQNGVNHGPRTELVNEINRIKNEYAMIYQDSYGGLYKLYGGNSLSNTFWGWWRPDGTSATNEMKVWTPTTVNCNFPEGVEVSICRTNVSDCLFDILNDPCETNNIASSYPAMVTLLRNKIAAYNATSFFPQQDKAYDPASNPSLYGGHWVPWLDPTEVLDRVPLTFAPFTPTTEF